MENKWKELLKHIAENNKEVKTYINTFLLFAEDSYILVDWPDSQEYMEEKWFEDEAILNNSDNAEPSSYFIPIKRIIP